MKRFLFIPLFVFAGLGFAWAAENPFNISFPVEELGGCGSMEECRTYCDEPEHIEACISFAEKKGLVKKEEAQQVRIVRQSIKAGEGPVTGCRNEVECRKACDNPENRARCFDWAQKKGLVKEESLERREETHEFTPEKKEKARRIIAEKGGPGGCASMEACSQYCEKEENFSACMAFAKTQGLMTEDEIQRAEKFKDREGPGGCKGIACREYCQNEDHQEECIEFATKNSLVSKEEVERVRKFRDATGPGGCRAEGCRTYCENSEHHDECFEFAKSHHLIPEEELERVQEIRKARHEGTIDPNELERRDIGPGGCKSERECLEYCSNPSHAEECGRTEPSHPQVSPRTNMERPSFSPYQRPVYSHLPSPSYPPENRPYEEFNESDRRYEYPSPTHEFPPRDEFRPSSQKGSILNRGLGAILELIRFKLR